MLKPNGSNLALVRTPFGAILLNDIRIGSVASMEKVLLAWSGGKDSALALYELWKENDYKVVALLTTLTADYDRVSMHGVRRSLLERQAESLGILLEKVYISKNASNEEYERGMRGVLVKYRDRGVSSVVFGDIFLEDVREYRENNISKVGMKGIFPLWKKDTTRLANEFIDLGFKAIITCTDSKFLDGRFVGRQYDRRFLSDLPPTVDPCGENGEFHTFAYEGPMFARPVPVCPGEVVEREGFLFRDLLPAGAVGAAEGDRRGPTSRKAS